MNQLVNYDSDAENAQNSEPLMVSGSAPGGVPNLAEEWDSFAKLVGCENTAAAKQVKSDGSDPVKSEINSNFYNPSRQSSQSSPSSHKSCKDGNESDSSRENSGASDSEKSETELAEDENSSDEENDDEEEENEGSVKSASTVTSDKEEHHQSQKRELVRKISDSNKDSKSDKRRSRSRSPRRKRSRSRSGSKHHRHSRSRDRRRRSRSRSRDGKRKRSRSRPRYRSSSRHRYHRKRSHERRKSRSRSPSYGRDSRRDDKNRFNRDIPRYRGHRGGLESNKKEIIRQTSASPPKSSKPLSFKEKMRQQLLETQRNLIESQIAGSEGTEQGSSLASSVQQPVAKPMNIQALLALGAGKGTPQQALAQAMAAMHQKAQELTGVKVPEYYNMAAVNPLKYAEQMKKRKMLWSKTKDNKDADKQWMSTVFQSDAAGESSSTTEKFRKLMGIKGNVEGIEVDEKLTEEQLKKQEELFRQLDRDYEFARMTTHTHRGVGLGFQSQGFLP